MSIPNIIYKIKGKMGIDKLTIMYLFIIVGVGIGSFGLGRISMSNTMNTNKDIPIMQKGSLLENSVVDNDEDTTQTQFTPREKRYVASKNGKMYYRSDCSGAKRIKSENEVWFSTSSDAEKSGYILSSTCR